MTGLGLELQKKFIGGYLWCALKRTFGQNFRELQKRSGKSGVEIANAMKVGPPLVAGWRNDRAGLPETPTLLRIAKVIRCTVDELLVGIDLEYDEIRRDLIRQGGEQRSNPLERGSDVPASGGSDSRSIEQLKQAVADATEVAHRLAGLLEQSGVSAESRSIEKPPTSVRRGHRKTG